MHTRTHRSLVGLGCALMAAAAIACSGCEDAPPTAPAAPGRLSPVIIEGSWAGTLTDVTAGSGELQMTATGYDTIAAGAFTLRLGARPAALRGGVAGNVRGPADIVLFMTLDPVGPECAEPGTTYIAELALVGDRLAGTYGPVTPCPLLRSGTIELVRR